MKTQLQWKTYWEHQLQPEDPAQLAEFFRNTYGEVGAWNATHFEGGRSWAGARPELRIIGYDERGVAAHYGLLRRFIRIGTIDQLVAEGGLYAVRSDLQGVGVVNQLHDVLDPTLHDLRVPFGFGTVRYKLREHIRRFGRGRATIMSGIRVRSTRLRKETETCIDDDVLVVVMPIECTIEDWPAGDFIDRNGPEL